ncbi:hypothetical protein NESM_000825200 [Novymonas esmeraldas]|uniref:Uncharacterized protein n=1 Tax=Novymonas esmeraldas TaxID=1808958 RepID=A0AAW0EZX9_9TRYP
MSSVATLSIDARKWAETIEAAGVDCLCSAVSAKNVTHVLSTATVRAPQKQLGAAVSNFVPTLLENTHGVSILTALVRYGTTTTVELVASKVAAADEPVWTFAAPPRKELVRQLSRLLERLVYREDCSGESVKALLARLKALKKTALLTSSFTLPATARLARVDGEFAASLFASSEAQKALAESCQDAATVAAAEEFLRVLFEKSTGDAAAGDFVWKALAPSMKASATVHPREAVLALLAAHAPAQLVNKMADALAQWPTAHDMCARDACMHIVAHLLERCDADQIGNKLVAAVVTAEADMAAWMAARSAAPQHLLAALASRPSYAQTLEKRLGSPQTQRLTAAKVRFTNSTQPKATATQQAIQEKLKKLQGSAGAGSKRARDEAA